MINLSALRHTWILDIDGTILKHNGYKLDGYDTLLDGVKEFFDSIPKDDKIILLTARENKHIDNLKKFLQAHNLRYDHLLSDIPVGERILVNDKKPSGLNTAYAINKDRDAKFNITYKIDKEI